MKTEMTEGQTASMAGLLRKLVEDSLTEALQEHAAILGVEDVDYEVSAVTFDESDLMTQDAGVVVTVEVSTSKGFGGKLSRQMERHLTLQCFESAR